MWKSTGCLLMIDDGMSEVRAEEVVESCRDEFDD